MDELIAFDPAPRTVAEYKAAIDRLLQEMDSLNMRMQQDRAEIERLKAETRIISAHIDTTLDSIEKQVAALHKGG